MRLKRTDLNLPQVALDGPFGPPIDDRPSRCLHCGRMFAASEMIWIALDNDPDDGMWYCPNEECDGADYGFDIHPMSIDERSNVNA